MIWTRGTLIADEALRISVLDRTFEHGLGLFETFRTWEGHATLLDRHLERMSHSSRALNLGLKADDLPDKAAVDRLREANGVPGREDVRVRITLTGGILTGSAPGYSSTLWMATEPLPSHPRIGGARIVRSILVDPDDPLIRHKTLNYWRRRIEQDRSANDFAEEVLCVTPDRLICEGTRSNLFLVSAGRLITPGAKGALLDGVMRRVVIERARCCGIKVVEGPVSLDAIALADEAFLTNSVRGILPISRLLHAEMPAPGPLTQRVWDEVFPWLVSGGTTP
jgi:branched-subunit amino acid aminotransferase/4-amino-4-deoxychorismate lyase